MYFRFFFPKFQFSESKAIFPKFWPHNPQRMYNTESPVQMRRNEWKPLVYRTLETPYSSHKAWKPHKTVSPVIGGNAFLKNTVIMQRKVQDKHAPSCWLFICPHVTSIPTLPIRKPFYYLTVTPKAKLASGNTSIKYKLITKLCPHLWWRVKWRQCYSHKSTLCCKGFAPPHCTGGNTEAQRAQPRPECRTLSLLWFTHHLSPKWEAEALAEPLTVICLARPGWATRKGEGSCHYDMPRPGCAPISQQMYGHQALRHNHEIREPSRWWLPVSGSTWKENGSHHSRPYNKKNAEQHENEELFCDGVLRSQSKSSLWQLERQACAQRTAYWEQQQKLEPVTGRNIYIIIVKLLVTECPLAWDSQGPSLRGATNSVGTWTGLCFGWWWREGPFWNSTEHFVFHNKSLSSREGTSHRLLGPGGRAVGPRLPLEPSCLTYEEKKRRLRSASGNASRESGPLRKPEI